MWKARLAFIGLMALAIFGGGALVGFTVARLIYGAPSTPYSLNTSSVLKQVQSLSELVTIKYVMEKVVVLEDPPKDTLGMLFTGESRVIMVAGGVVKAGVDLSKLKETDLHLRGTNITINLPPATILDAYLDDKKTQVMEHKTGLMRKYDRNLEQEARRQAVDDIRRAAKYQGITTEADLRVKEELRRLFNSLGLGVEFK
ncbi:MAG: DUF4230 domain-containing protein [Verrucomicrobiota bacterium]